MSTQRSQDTKRVTVPDILALKAQGQRVAVMTAYDYSMAMLVDGAGADIILVGDSLGMVVLGYESTLPVTMEEMLHHCKAVKRGARRALLVGDMPFMSYQTGMADALHNAGRFLKEAGMDAVKLEGGMRVVPLVREMVAAGIPVMGHLGLTPQSVAVFGGFKVQGRDADTAYRLIKDALALQEAGCFSIVLESIPDRVAALITHELRIPTIGIGAGVECDGQVLVLYDVVGLFQGFTPKFVRRYAELHAAVAEALQAYNADVRAGRFPGPEQTFHMADDEYQRLLRALDAPDAPA